MAQTGYTPILIYSSSTVSQAPSAGNLTNSTLGSELAINITDGKLFYKDNANAVQVIAWKTTPTTAGGTGLTSYTAGDLLYYATGTTLTKLAIGASGRWLGSSGTAPQWNAPAALTKTDDTNVTLTLGGSASTALLNAASLTLGWTGTLAVSRGGTGTGTAFTAGSVIFAGTSGVYSQDNANFFWDDANNRLGLGTALPSYLLDVNGNARVAGITSKLYFDTLSSAASNYIGTTNDFDMTLYNGRGGNPNIVLHNTDGIQFKSGTTLDVSIKSGNVVIGTSGKGIDFSAAGGDVLTQYDEYTAASTACQNAITTACVWKLTKIGNQVTITLPKVTGTAGGSNVNFVLGANIPSAYRPTADIGFYGATIINNGAVVTAPGFILITTAGSIIVYRDSSGLTAWTNGATAGLNEALGISWTI